MPKNGILVFILLSVVLSLEDEQEITIFPNNVPQESINFDELFKTVSLMEQDIEGVVHQFGKMFANIMQQYEKDPGNWTLPTNGQQSAEYQQLIHGVNLVIKMFNKVETLAHAQLKDIDLTDPNAMYQYGGYAVMAGIVYKMFSFKRVIKLFLS